MVEELVVAEEGVVTEDDREAAKEQEVTGEMMHTLRRVYGADPCVLLTLGHVLVVVLGPPPRPCTRLRGIMRLSGRNTMSVSTRREE